MVEFTANNGEKVSIASDAVAMFYPSYNKTRCKTVIHPKHWSEEASIEVMEEYEAVKQALKSDDWERSNGRC